MLSILNRSLFYFLILVVCSFSLASCGGKDDDPKPENLPDRPIVDWQSVPAADRVLYTDEAVVLQAVKTGGYVKELEWQINGVKVTNSQEIIINEDTTSISLAHSFDTPGRYDVSLRVANEGGETTIIRVLNFVVRPVPPTDILAGQVSKKWRFTSIKLNDGPELIRDYEADNTLQFFRETQTDPATNTTFNCVFDKGTLTNGEQDSKGRWKLIFNETYIEFTRIDVFPSNTRIIELKETEIILGRKQGDSDIIYKLTLVP